MCLRRGKDISTEDENYFDPSCFGDSVAMRTQWFPMCAGGANFDTHELILVSDYRIEFRVLPMTYIFSTVILATASIFIIGLFLAKDVFLIFFIFFVFIFLLVSEPWNFFNRVVFDKRKMLFWRGNAEYDFYVDSDFDKNAKLNNIYAIQLLCEVVENMDGPDYDRYEIKLF